MTLPIARCLWRLTCAFLVFAGHCQSSSFKPNYTIPAESVNYVAGPNTRSTLSIVWNCFSVIVLCTWNVLHLNVPSIYRSKGFWDNIRLVVLASTTKFKWMVVAILVPEYLLGKALSERLSVTFTLFPPEKGDPDKDASDEGAPDEDTPIGEWEAVHYYLANMGYFVLDVQPELGVVIETTTDAGQEQKNKPAPNSREGVLCEDVELAILEQGDWSGVRDTPGHTNEIEIDPAQRVGQSRPSPEATEKNTSSVNYPPSHRLYQAKIEELLAEEGLSTSKRINLRRLQHRSWALSTKQWKFAFKEGLAAVPHIPSVHLDKLDKGGALVKLLAIDQVLYLIIQLISRKVQGLPSSQLEIATLAFSVLSLFTYLI
ncbi:hypothetical protein F5Y13DRAFT_196350 [Hypoxylon sp. FL1857]|nr:hypothetical protein F5Y13DRAFT_196350 [Hypoxylon sp. FL1857]